MKLSQTVQDILSNYSSENPGVKSNLAKILMHGKLGGTGKMVILPVDQGFEHGPARSFAINSVTYDPLYHYQLAIEAELNAYAAPLGMLEMGADKFAGCIPTILKMNSANSLVNGNLAPDQAITASVKDALRLGCSAIGFTIYPGSDKCNDMIEEYKVLSHKAKSYGLACVLWSYARGSGLSKDGETALDVIAYAAHISALLGANIIKVKLPTSHIEQEAAAKVYQSNNIERETLTQRVKHVVQSCFNGKRLVIFSGGTHKQDNDLVNEITAINEGGGNGSIIGRNTFQRPKDKALKMLSEVTDIYLKKLNL